MLRALQEGEVTRVGGAKSMKVDVRVLAATNKDLEAEIAAGRFREDLLYRINVVPIEVPPLRERAADIPDLVAHFARRVVESAGIQARSFEPGAIERLQRRSWPGNVRELRNAVERLMILSTGKAVTAADVDRILSGAGGGARAGRPLRTAGRSLHGAHLRGVQAGGGEGVPDRQAAAIRLERVGNGAGARHAALQPLQEDRALRPHAGAGMSDQPRDWDKELAAIDKVIAKGGVAPSSAPAPRGVGLAPRRPVAAAEAGRSPAGRRSPPGSAPSSASSWARRFSSGPISTGADWASSSISAPPAWWRWRGRGRS